MSSPLDSRHRRALQFPVTIGGVSGLLTGYWSGRAVEVTLNGQTEVVLLADLVRRCPELLAPLCALVERTTPEPMARAKIRLMHVAAESTASKCVKNGRLTPQEREQRRVENHAKETVKAADVARGMVRLHADIDTLVLNGVTPDGRDWLICGHRVTLTQLAVHYPDQLPQLLHAARPGLRNFGAFLHAALQVYPWLAKDRTLANYARTDQIRRSPAPSPDFRWVADCLAAHRRTPTPLLPFSRPLNNRVRHVR
jgi:hypothetical protein